PLRVTWAPASEVMEEPAAKLRFELGPTFHVPAVNACDADNCATAPLTLNVLLLRLTRPVLLRLPATFRVEVDKMMPPVLFRLPVTFRVALFKMMPPALLRFPAVVKLCPPTILKMLPAAMVFRLFPYATFVLSPLRVTWAPASDVILEPAAKFRFDLG